MLTNYLEENPEQAKTIVQKVILAATARNAAAKAREMVQRKSVLVVDCLVNYLIAPKKIQKNVKSFSRRRFSRWYCKTREG